MKGSLLVSERPPVWQLILAFASLYLIWGSTYLGIKIAIESIPPFLMAAARFLVAGAFLFGFARWRGAGRPTLRQWKIATVIGASLIAGGNGLVTLAETRIDSSMAALIITSNPLLMTLLGWWAGVQRRPGWISSVSLLVGFGGVALLIFSSGGVRLKGESLGYLLTLVAVVCWTSGSIYSKRNPQMLNPWMHSGMQMIAGGVVCLILGIGLGEVGAFDLGGITTRSWVAFTYLIFFGSLAGYTSYVFLLRHCPPAMVSSHAYINPVVAIFLGWLVLGETLTLGGWIGSVLVLAAVFALLRRMRG